MRLEKASRKAVDYACKKFHYSQNAAPRAHDLAFSVFENDVFCGVICFGRGATNDIGKPYGLNSGECIELIRVALNGNQHVTSKALSIAIRLVVKYAPLTKMLVSFADPEQNHVGTIYQATNWYYVGKSTPEKEYYLDGKKIHGRTFRSKGKPKRATETVGSSKYRYIYPLDKSLIPLCKSLAKPYPKKQHAAVAHKGEQLASSQEGAFDSTLPLKTETEQ